MFCIISEAECLVKVVEKGFHAKATPLPKMKIFHSSLKKSYLKYTFIFHT